MKRGSARGLRRPRAGWIAMGEQQQQRAVFDPPSPSLPPPPPVPTREDPAVEEARRKQLQAARKARGRPETVLTTGLGDMTEATVRRKTLLGS